MDKEKNICADCAFNVGTCADGSIPENGKCSGYRKATKFPAYIDEVAIAAYDAYCAEVGGVNFKGEPLPCGKEFFADKTKQKQADGWRAAAMKVQGYFAQRMSKELAEAYRCTEAF